MKAGGQRSEVGDRKPDDGSTSRSMLEGARLENAQAWVRLTDLYTPLVITWCRRWGVAAQDVSDIVQEVFAAVARSVGRFRKEQPHDTFRGWLATIARNKARDYFRRHSGEPAASGGTEAWQRISQARDPAQETGTDDDNPQETALGDLLSRALESIRGEFQERTWLAFWQTTVEGRSAAEAAAELGMQPGAVRVAKSRVLWRLRSELGDQPREC